MQLARLSTGIEIEAGIAGNQRSAGPSITPTRLLPTSRFPGSSPIPLGRVAWPAPAGMVMRGMRRGSATLQRMARCQSSGSIHWANPMEVSIRAANWILAFGFFQGAPEDERVALAAIPRTLSGTEESSEGIWRSGDGRITITSPTGWVSYCSDSSSRRAGRVRSGWEPVAEWSNRSAGRFTRTAWTTRIR
jgi:hypothetical protein